MSKLKYALCTGLLLLLCVASLSIPTLAANWQESLLMQKPIKREEMQNALSEEARKIPIAYALHKRRLAEGLYTGNEYECTPEIKQEMLAVLKELINAKIMPQRVYDEICLALESPQAEIYCREDKTGFKEASVSLAVMQGEEIIKILPQATLQWHAATALATKICYKGTQLDIDEPVKAFQKYLGVDVLSDWYEINENGAIYSDMGQLYMLCKQKDNMVYFTIAPVSRNEILNK